MIRKRPTATFIFTSISMLVFSMFCSATTYAESFNPNRIISDAVFDNVHTMNATQINNFLNQFPNSCISPNSGFKAILPTGYNPSGGYQYGSHVTAGEVINDAAQAYGINPQVLLATLQKEQSLVMGGSGYCNDGDEHKYAAAVGYGCPDGGSRYSYSGINLYQRNGVTRTSVDPTCVNSASKAGFSQQVIRAAWLLKFGQQRALGNIQWAVIKGSWDNSDDPQSCYGGPMSQGTWQRCPSGGSSYYDGYITIDNQPVHIESGATAALYWYTPHFHGNQNFFNLFSGWFGSPLVGSSPYSGSIVKQEAYVDSGRTKHFSDDISMTPGQTAYFRVTARNQGYKTWDRNVVRIATIKSPDRSSVFANDSWRAPNRIEMQQTSVLPGDIATFEFSVTAPSTAESYYENFQLVADGAQWFPNASFVYQIDVVTSRSPVNTENTRLDSGSSLPVNKHLLSPDSQSMFKLQSDGNLVLYINFRPIWASNILKAPKYLLMQADGNLVLYDTNNKPVWASNTNGNPGAYASLQTDGNLVIYSAANQPLWATGTITTPDRLQHVNKTLSNASMYPVQRLETANSLYRLVFQADGNLVLYTNTHKVLWATGTDGRNTSHFSMQADGNLVLYDTNNKPVWASNTNGNPGAYLFMQADGNLVIYSKENKPLWATNTNGRL